MQIQNKRQQRLLNIDEQKQKFTLFDNVIVEDSDVQETVAQEIIIEGHNITHITAGPYTGFQKGPLQIAVVVGRFVMGENV